MRLGPVIPVIKGLLTFLPGTDLIPRERRTGGTDSALYCYGVWLKHLTLLWEGGMRSIPRTLAELGPGDSLGTGLAAMLCGVNRYYALDAIRFSNVAGNLRIFDELVRLLRERSPRPHEGWPDFDRYLDARLFPSHILTDSVLDSALAPERVAKIRQVIEADGGAYDEIAIRYLVPWSEDLIEKESVDVLLSHTVLQYVTDLEKTQRAISVWLGPGAWFSHQIDLRAIGLSSVWNEHWAWSDILWQCIAGRRLCGLINRLPRSAHIALIEKQGMHVERNMHLLRTDGIGRSQLARRWRQLSDDDLTCSSAFIQGRKPEGSARSRQRPRVASQGPHSTS